MSEDIDVLKLVIWGQAPSVNSLYRIDPRDGHLYLTRRGRNYKKVVKELLTEQMQIKLPKSLRGKLLQIHFKFYFKSLFHRDGKPVERDYDGPIKIVQDAVAEALKFNDCYIFKGTAEKRRGQRERTVIIIEPYEREPDEDDED